LIAQFGRKAVLEALADATDTTAEQIQGEIVKLETTRRVKSSKREKPLDELLESLSPKSPSAREMLVQLGRMFEAKMFLPNLRDAEDFFRRSGASNRKFKSRKEAFAPVLKRLSEMPESELALLVAHSTNTTGNSDFAVLANQLMGKKP
jgi:hypothetical protein